MNKALSWSSQLSVLETSLDFIVFSLLGPAPPSLMRQLPSVGSCALSSTFFCSGRWQLVTRVNPSGPWATKQQVLNLGVIRTTPQGSEKIPTSSPHPWTIHQNMRSVAQASELLMLSVDSNARLKTSTSNWPTRLQEGRDNYSSDHGTWMDASLVQRALARNILHHFTPVHTSSLSICVMAWKILARDAINNAGDYVSHLANIRHSRWKKGFVPSSGAWEKKQWWSQSKKFHQSLQVILKTVLQILL